MVWILFLILYSYSSRNIKVGSDHTACIIVGYCLNYELLLHTHCEGFYLCSNLHRYVGFSGDIVSKGVLRCRRIHAAHWLPASALITR